MLWPPYAFVPDRLALSGTKRGVIQRVTVAAGWVTRISRPGATADVPAKTFRVQGIQVPIDPAHTVMTWSCLTSRLWVDPNSVRRAAGERLEVDWTGGGRR